MDCVCLNTLSQIHPLNSVIFQDFPYINGLKMILKWFEWCNCVIRLPICTKICKVLQKVDYNVLTKWELNRKYSFDAVVFTHTRISCLKFFELNSVFQNNNILTWNYYNFISKSYDIFKYINQEWSFSSLPYTHIVYV